MEEKVFDSDFFSKLSVMKLNSKLKLHGGTGGTRTSSAKGTSVEYSDFREYNLGDDIRRIDWNAFGRMDRLFVKLFREEKEAYFHICVDCSGSMNYGFKKKSIAGLQLAGMFAYLALHQMDRVSIAALFEGNMLKSKAMTGMQSFQKILTSLEQLTFGGQTNLKDSVRKIPFTGKGVTILVSDFLEPADPKEWIDYLMYQKQEIILIHVLSGEEWEPDFEGTSNLIDMETGEEMRITLTGRAKSTYHKELEQFQQTLRGLSRKYGISYLTMDTRESLDSFIYKGLKSGQLSIF